VHLKNFYLFFIFIFFSTSLETKPTINLLSSPPKHKNPELEQKINKNKDKSELNWCEEDLTDADMEIVGYYLLQNNQVSNVI
jgi:hypothetical protein